MDRFLAYTKGREPLITVNVLAAILLGIVVRVAEQYLGFAWDEFSLTAAGAIAVAIATWLARRGVWSPASVERTVEAHAAQSLRQGFDEGYEAGRQFEASAALKPQPMLRRPAAADDDGDGR
jgi:hypothetical protein